MEFGGWEAGWLRPWTPTAALQDGMEIHNEEFFELRGDVHMNISPTERCTAISQAWQTLSASLFLNSKLNSVLNYVGALYRNTVQFTMSVQYDCLTFETKNLLKSLLKESPYVPCQMLSQLLPNPWSRFPISSLFICDAEDGTFDRNHPLSFVEHSCSSECSVEPRHLSRARVEVLCYANLGIEALQLCLAYGECCILKKDSFYKASAFHLLHSMGDITRLTAEVSKMSCHDGYHLIQQIQTNYGLASDFLVECLNNIFLVQDFVGPSSYCCTLSLINLWITIHIYKNSSLAIVAEEAFKIGMLASTSAHVYLLVDVLYAKFGRKLLGLYLQLYIHALTWDLNNLEYSKLLDCDVAVIEMETHLAAVYTKLASLLSIEEDFGIARECVLTAFSLEPTSDRLTRLKLWSTSGYSNRPPRLNPCAGQCHCSEKGLCRQNLHFATWYSTYMTHEILDSPLGAGILSNQILHDLCIVIEGPRCKRLTWNLSWDMLSVICEQYMMYYSRAGIHGESLEARLRRRTQLEKWVCSSTSVLRPTYEEDDADNDDRSNDDYDDDDDEAMPTLEREEQNDVDVDCTKSSSQIASQTLESTDWIVKRSSTTTNDLPILSKGENQQDLFKYPPLLNERYQMTRMDCIELEEAVRQLTDNDITPTLEVSQNTQILSHPDSVPRQSSRPLIVYKNVVNIKPIESLPALTVYPMKSESENLQIHTKVAEQSNPNPQTTLESLLDSVSTINAEEFDQTSCDGIELLANSAIQFGSLVGHQRSSSEGLPIAAVDSSVCETSTHHIEVEKPPPETTVSQVDNQKVLPRPISLSELVQSVLSDDPPLMSPTQTSLEYNWPHESGQANYELSATDTITLINDSVHNYAKCISMPSSDYFNASQSNENINVPITTESSETLSNNFSTVTTPRTVILTFPNATEPQYLTLDACSSLLSNSGNKDHFVENHNSISLQPTYIQIKPEPSTEMSKIKMTTVTNEDTINNQMTTATPDYKKSIFPCNDILRQATISALGDHDNDQYQPVIVEPQFTTNTVPTALQMMTVTDSKLEQATTHVRRRSVFNHRKDRCKWMPVYNAHGKLDYRKVVERKVPSPVPPSTPTEINQKTLSTTINKVGTPSIITTVANTTTAISTLPTTLTLSVANQNSSQRRPSLPIVKKCYSPVLFGGSANTIESRCKNLPKVFTVSAPTMPVVRPVSGLTMPDFKREPRSLLNKTTINSSVNRFVSIAKTYLETGLNRQQEIIGSKLPSTTTGTTTPSISILPVVSPSKPINIIKQASINDDRLSGNSSISTIPTGSALPVSLIIKSPVVGSSVPTDGATLNRINMLQPKVVLEQCDLMDNSSSSNRTPTKIDVISEGLSMTRIQPGVTGNEMIPCPVCNKLLSSCYLRRHIKTIHKDEVQSESPLKHFPTSPTLKVNVVRLNMGNMKPFVTGSEMRTVEQSKSDDIVNIGSSHQMEPTKAIDSLPVVNGATAEEMNNLTAEDGLSSEAENHVDDNLSVKEELISRFMDDFTIAESQQLSINEEFRPLDHESVDDVDLDSQEELPACVRQIPKYDAQSDTDESTEDSIDNDDENDEDYVVDKKITKLTRRSKSNHVLQSGASLLTRGRGRTSARSVKVASKRGCHCCEHDSTNSSVGSSTPVKLRRKGSQGIPKKKKNKKNENHSHLMNRRANRTICNRSLRVTRNSTMRAKT